MGGSVNEEHVREKRQLHNSTLFNLPLLLIVIFMEQLRSDFLHPCSFFNFAAAKCIEP